MTRRDQKPGLLVLTTTYPRWQDDHEPPFVHELSRRLTDHFAVTVLAPHAPGAKRHERLDDVDVERFRYAPNWLEHLAYDGGIPYKLRHRPWLALLVPFFLLAQLLASWRLLRRLKPQAIHAHWLLPQGLIALLARRLAGRRIRLLITAHGADLHGLRSPLSRWLKRCALRGADDVTVVSRAMAKEARALADMSDKLQVLPMGVDLRTRFTPGPVRSCCQTLVFAGRLVEKKGVTYLLEAMALLAPSWPESRLLLAGSGPLKDSLLQQAQRLGLAGRVEFLGSYDNASLPDILRRADLAVFPFTRAASGDQEGLGLVVVEAQGCGLPVIVSALPAVHDMVRDGETGLLVPPRDPQTLAGAIDALLSNPVRGKCLARTGRQFALEHFDWAGIAERHAGLLQKKMDSV